MKTTIDLPDDLLIEAKAVAARRRTTLKAIVEHALRRELVPPRDLSADSPFEIGRLGLPVLKKRGKPLTEEDVRQLLEMPDEEDFQRAMEIREGKA